MGKNIKVDLYTLLFLQAQEAPSDPDIWEKLSKHVPTLSAKTSFSKYAKYLQTNIATRYYRPLTAEQHEVFYVTFVVLSQTIMPRVEKVASAARAAGIKIQLLLCFLPNEHFSINTCLFEEIIIVDDMLLNINDALKKAYYFKSSLIHMFIDCVTNLSAALWSMRSQIPIIGDAYDLCCSQYNFWPDNEKAREDNVFYENVWLQHIDGICTRTHYMKTKRLQDAYRPGIPVYYMPEPMRSSSSIRNLENIDPTKLNIIMDGMATGSVCYMEAYNEVFFHARKAGNIQFHVYRYDGYDVSEYADMVHTYSRLPQNIFHTLLKKCDAFMLPWCEDYIKEGGYSLAMEKYCTRSTASDIFEADIVNIIPDYFELIGKNAVKCKRGITFSREDQTTYDFWKALPQRVAQLRITSPNYHRFLDTTQARHLKSFYCRVVSKAARRASTSSSLVRCQEQ